MKRYYAVATDTLCYLVGSILFAISVTVFISPNQITGGGITGIAILLNYVAKTPIGTVILLLNIPLFIWGYFEGGLKFILKSAIATVLSSVAIDFTTHIFPVYDGDKMLACIFGGILSGLGLGLLLIRNATTGGSDLAAAIVARHIRHISIGRLIFIIDVLIVGASMIVYHSLESALYGMIVIFLSAKVIDAVIYGTGVGSGKFVFIISQKSTEITLAINTDIGRGITLLKGAGGYTGTEMNVIMCATRRYELVRVQDIAYSIDPDCFIISGEAEEISGLGFRKQ